MKPLLFPLFALLFLSCQSSRESVIHFRGIALTIPYHIQVGGNLSHAKKEKIKRLIDDTFEETDHLYNHWNSDSELSHINHASTEEAIPLSPALLNVIKLAKNLTQITEGRYDPTLGAHIQLWKQHLKQGITPPDTDSASGWKHILIDMGTLYKKKKVSIDLDGMIKGYVVDTLAQKLDALECKDHYVDWGGDIRVSKSHPSGRPWTVLIHSPLDEGEVIALSDGAIASSGDYEQLWVTSSGTYTHIVSPKTGQALKRVKGSIVGVTVQAPTCFLADALATACMTFPTAREAEDWAKEVKERLGNSLNFWIFSSEADIINPVR